ncbi:MAG: DEAD/DEAH box helicase [Thermoproteota archaeon]
MSLQELPVSEETKNLLRKVGIEKLYPPQSEAINRGVLEGKNLVLSTPTASGKTLVALMLIAERLLAVGGKAVYLVPLRALASEKFLEFKPLQYIKHKRGRQVRIAISTGDYDSPASELEPYDVVITTYEKMDSILRHRPRWLGGVKTLVFDEVHLLDETKRGPTLEMLITWTKKLLPESQILAMSATIPNDREIADWLGAELVSMVWRPVPLLEGVYIENSITFDGGKKIELEDIYADSLMNLAAYSIKDNGQGLFFAPSRRSAVASARKLKPVSWLILSNNEKERLRNLSKEVLDVVEETSLSRELAECVKFGVAFHHAGLAHAHRLLIEDAYRKRLIKLLVATPTLAAGVNLPSRLVCPISIYRYQLGIGSVEITTREYKQMAGRAGRPQYDDHGEAVLIASDQDQFEYLMDRYIRGEIEPINSKMDESLYLSSAVLATAAVRFAKDVVEMQDVFKRTLLYKQRGEKRVFRSLLRKLKFLEEGGAIEINDGGGISVTTLGKRISELYVAPETAFELRKLLEERPSNFTSLSVLHMICLTQDMPMLSYSGRREGERIQYLLDVEKAEELYHEDTGWLFEQTKTALALFMWINEESEDNILSTLNVEPGDLHTIVESAQWLLYALKELARIMGYDNLLKLIEITRERVKHGVKEDVLDLVRLSGIGRVRARRLFRAGYKSVDDLTHASVSDLSNIPGIGTKLAISIKEQAGGLIKRKDLAKPDALQTSVTDFLGPDDKVVS